jgi:small-conductance mechanosensitive channel
MESDFLQQVYLGNSVRSYLWALGLFVVLWAALKAFRAVVLIRLRRLAQVTETTLDDFLIRAVEGAVMPVLNYGAFYIAVNSLALSDRLGKALYAVSSVYLVFYTVRLALAAIRHSLEQQLLRRPNGRERLGQLKGMMVVIGAALWALGVVFVLGNLGYDITAVVTGLGIGGIAIALAAQNILGDLFNYFVIFFDRPFEVGDNIQIDDKRGVVEQIGIKTTRIRSVTGEELIIANTNLTSSRIHNFRRLEDRRATQLLAVTYGTPADKLRAIPEIARRAVETQPKAAFERCHFRAYGPSSLDFELVYLVKDPEAACFFATQHGINLALYEAFAREGIAFAFPTQTLHVHSAKP